MSLHMSKYHIVENHMSRLKYKYIKMQSNHINVHYITFENDAEISPRLV